MLETIEANRQVVLRYTDPTGRLDDQWNPNGSVNAIAGLCNERRNVVGMMPHPERACEALLGGVDGRAIFESIVAMFRSAESLALQGAGAGRSASLSRLRLQEERASYGEARRSADGAKATGERR
jgi:hypothetical protein